MNLLLRRRAMMQPMEVVEIEYLQCPRNSSAIISIPIDCKVGQTLEVEFTIRLLSTTSTYFLGVDVLNQFDIWLRNSKLASRIGGTVNLSGPTYSDITVPGTFVFSSDTRPISSDISALDIFRRRDSSSPGVNFYSTVITIDNIVVRDLVPVRIGAAGYMYDRVSGQLFGNSGSEAIVLGPDV